MGIISAASLKAQQHPLRFCIGLRHKDNALLQQFQIFAAKYRLISYFFAQMIIQSLYSPLVATERKTYYVVTLLSNALSVRISYLFLIHPWVINQSHADQLRCWTRVDFKIIIAVPAVRHSTISIWTIRTQVAATHHMIVTKP